LTTSLDPTLGNICLSALYGTFTLVSIPAPRLVHLLGPRLSIVFGGIPYVLMVASFLLPSDLPMAVTYSLKILAYSLTGIGAAMLWCGAGVYIGRCAINSATESGTCKERSTTKMNSLFFSIYQSNGIIGNSIASIIAMQGSKSNDNNTQNILFIVLAIIAGIGLVVFFMLPNVEQAEDDDGEAADGASFTETLSLFFSDTRMTLTAVNLLYNGFSLGFLFGTYTYEVKQILGPNWIGFVMAAFFGVNVVSTTLGGLLTGAVGKVPVYTMAALFQAAFYVYFFIWGAPPAVDTDSYATMFGGAAVFAMGDAIWESQVPAMLQSFFKENPSSLDAAMGNVKFWQSLGFFLQFIVASAVGKARAFDVSIYTLGGLLLLAHVSVIMAVWRDRRQRNSNYDAIPAM